MQEYNSQDNPNEWNKPTFSYTDPEVSSDLVLGWQTEITEPSRADENRTSSPIEVHQTGPHMPSAGNPELSDLDSARHAFSVEQFSGERPTKLEKREIAKAGQHLFTQLREQHADFLDRDFAEPDPSWDPVSLVLEHSNPSGETVVMEFEGDGNVLEIHVSTETDGKKRQHDYYARGEHGTIHRESYNPVAVDQAIAEDERTTYIKNHLGLASAREDAVGTFIDAGMTAPFDIETKKIGPEEAEYISTIALQAEPKIVSASMLVNSWAERHASQVLPLEDTSERAAELFKHDIQSFLHRQGYEPGNGEEPAIASTEMVDADGTLARLQAGEKIDEGEGVRMPFVELSMNHPVRTEDNTELAQNGVGTVRMVLAYTVVRDKLVGVYRHDMYDAQGALMYEEPQQMVFALPEDAYDVRNFLRKPVLRKPNE
jgi:hypothetical protein